MIADDDPRIRHDFGYKGERAEMERFIAPYPALVALSAKIRQKTIEAWGAGDGETPDEDAWESGDPDNPGVVELVFGFQEQYATLTGALVDGFSEGGEYDYDPYFLSQGVCPGCWEGCIGEGGPICACEQRGALEAREWRMSQDEAVEEGWDWSRPARPLAIPGDVFADLETGQLIRPGRKGTRDQPTYALLGLHAQGRHGVRWTTIVARVRACTVATVPRTQPCATAPAKRPAGLAGTMTRWAKV